MRAAVTASPDRLFLAGKYLIYLLILANTTFFLFEDMSAAAYTFRDGVTLADIKNAFATFVDSASWFILLIIFELETFVLSDRFLQGRIRWAFDALIALSYAFVILAFTGYVSMAETTYEFEPIAERDTCSLIGVYDSLAIGLDDYHPLSAENCTIAQELPLQANARLAMVADSTTVSEMRRLAATDVVNAGTWIIIVFVLWLDVVLQLRGHLTGAIYKSSAVIKGLCYSVLIVACLYWFWLTAWIDALDALLWLLAFFAIELNLFNWHREVSQNSAPAAEP